RVIPRRGMPMRDRDGLRHGEIAALQYDLNVERHDPKYSLRSSDQPRAGGLAELTSERLGFRRWFLTGELPAQIRRRAAIARRHRAKPRQQGREGARHTAWSNR